MGEEAASTALTKIDASRFDFADLVRQLCSLMRLALPFTAAFYLALGSTSLHAENIAEGEAVGPRVKVWDEEPARLAIGAPEGAEVHVDGELLGKAPFARQVNVAPGKRRLVVTMNGQEVREQELLFEAGRTQTIEVELEDTTQRSVAWTLLGAGAVSLGAGITFGVLSVIEHRRSRDLRGFPGQDDLDDEEQAEFDAAIAARDNYRIVSGVTGGASLGLFVVGGILYAFDEPTRPTPRDAAAPRSERPSFSVSLIPIVAPDVAGAWAEVRF